ncbi:hypothetical protein [Mangrovicoccus sp. HB161399]|uniref:hypothetical protein n=1 Tax=Mangrovicoccus sp. HB161399 TaxID=2720392 RepID=UPI001551CEED|nr:hypothetical protein [Mangrovicoccus sp. HB161399]
MEMVLHMKPSLALAPVRDQSSLRIEASGKHVHHAATLGLIDTHEGVEDRLGLLSRTVRERFADLDELAKILKDNAKARDRLIYAQPEGLEPGPEDMEAPLRKLAAATMGVLWAAVDVTQHAGERAPVGEMLLKATVALNNDAKPRKNSPPQQGEG